MPAWETLVTSGKKTAADLLAMLSTRAAFSDEQRAAIMGLGIVKAEPLTPDQKPVASDTDVPPWEDAPQDGAA